MDTKKLNDNILNLLGFWIKSKYPEIMTEFLNSEEYLTLVRESILNENLEFAKFIEKCKL